MAARRDRVLSAMAESGIDVLVLGRQDNAGYACGMRRLWTAGTRPFGAGCIVVRATGRVHALSSWDAGIEAPMSFEDLYPLTWNPRIMAASMAAIDGLAEAARIGVDEFTPSFRRAAANFAPRGRGRGRRRPDGAGAPPQACPARSTPSPAPAPRPG